MLQKRTLVFLKQIKPKKVFITFFNAVNFCSATSFKLQNKTADFQKLQKVSENIKSVLINSLNKGKTSW